MSKEPRAGREEILECQVMWEPDSKKNTQMDRFRAAVGAACGLSLGECGVRVPGGSPATSWLDQGLSEIGLLPWPSEGPLGRETAPGVPGAPVFLDVGVRAHLNCWNGLLIFIFPPLGVGGATGRGGPPLPRGWDPSLGGGTSSDCGVLPACLCGVSLPLFSRGQSPLQYPSLW